MAQTQYIREDTNMIFAPIATATLVNIGDFVCVSSGEVIPANDVTWAGSKAATQQAAVAAFAGHAFQLKQADVPTVYGNGQSNIIGVSTTGVYEADLQSATTLLVGDFIGLAKNNSANELLPQTVEKVASLNLAIGVCVQAGVDLERCLFRILPSVTPFAPVPATTTTPAPTTTTPAPTTSSTTTGAP